MQRILTSHVLQVRMVCFLNTRRFFTLSVALTLSPMSLLFHTLWLTLLSISRSLAHSPLSVPNEQVRMVCSLNTQLDDTLVNPKTQTLNPKP